MKLSGTSKSQGETWRDIALDFPPVGPSEWLNSPDFGRPGDKIRLANVGQVGNRPHYVVVLCGIGGAKKNRYTPKGKAMVKGSELQAELNNLEMQVPGDVRDLRLEHPDLVFRFKCRNGRRDRDGIVTTILDILVRCGTLVNDNIFHCNGRITIDPAEVCDGDEVTVEIYPK